MTSSSLKMHTPQICECSKDPSCTNSMARFAHFLSRREKCRRGGLHSICFHCTQAIFFPPFQKISCLLHMREKLRQKKNLFFVYPAGEYTLQHHAGETLGGLQQHFSGEELQFRDDDNTHTVSTVFKQTSQTTE